jgi:hypothetical protein
MKPSLAQKTGIREVDTQIEYIFFLEPVRYSDQWSDAFFFFFLDLAGSGFTPFESQAALAL